MSTIKVVVLSSISSDIGRELAFRYARDGYAIIGTYRSEEHLNGLKKLPNCRLFPCDIAKKEQVSAFLKAYAALNLPWDIFISCAGTPNPIGKFFDIDFDYWSESVHVNAIEQLRVLHGLYPYRNKTGAAAVFFAGPGANNPFTNYSAYVASKIMLIKMCELLDDEAKDLNVFIVGPGWTKSKTHYQTLEAGEERAGAINYQKTVEFMKQEGGGTSMDDIYGCINWLQAQGRGVASGRNFSVVHDKWKGAESSLLAAELKSDSNMYKLRRHRNAP
ncbi:SDR family oxidoreductase [Candidatus Woesearchaeota archaeon]|nr:SDR family oxidoreductase [Candidatus Woesearchaeota archaeon]